jgi:S-DNA-T family DNA segregation ATPase FtsK/SpoIIIE
MAKKKSDKETEPKKVSTKRFSAFLKNETTHFVIGLISVIFAVYLLLAFSSLRGPPTKVFWIISSRVN